MDGSSFFAFLSVCGSKIFSHLSDGFVIDEIGSRDGNAELCSDVRHHADEVKGAQAEIRLKIVFSRDFVNFNVIFKDCDKFFE